MMVFPLPKGALRSPNLDVVPYLPHIPTGSSEVDHDLAVSRELSLHFSALPVLYEQRATGLKETMCQYAGAFLSVG